MQKQTMQNPFPNELYHSRIIPREPDIRGDYFRDQTAIIHASPFRRLKHKTQVFFSPQNDHICTRIEHVLHVSTIATTICKGLGLDVELAQAISLGHDLGHAPFGHAGEHILNKLTKSFGGFIHEVHGLRVVDKLTRKGKGLNLTYAVRDGIISHCGEKFERSLVPTTEKRDLETINTRQTAPLSYEACVVRIADKIAYLGRDIEDAITGGLITPKDIPRTIKRNLGSTNGEIIDTLVIDVIKSSSGKDSISFSDNKFDLIDQLKDFNYKYIYHNEILKRSDKHIANLIEHLYIHLSDLFQKNKFDMGFYKQAKLLVDKHFGEYVFNRQHLYEKEKRSERCIADFIAGMTDSYALESAREVLFPRPIERR